MTLLRRFLGDRTAASAVEFAMVLPILLFLLLGIIDVGRLMYEWNMAEKATQMGVRYAVVTDFVPNNLNEGVTDFTAGSYNLSGGTSVPTSVFSSTTCQLGSCTSWGYKDAAFKAIVARMQLFYPKITNSNVTVEYENVGLGYAGDPTGPDVSALVTVRLKQLQFRPWSLLGYSITLPDFKAALTMEDGSGSGTQASN